VTLFSLAHVRDNLSKPTGMELS